MNLSFPFIESFDPHVVEDKDISLTPLGLICSLGQFDLDPCGVQEHQTAQRIISLPQCGLESEWSGRVWLNPPYSAPSPWLEKLLNHGNGIALVLSSTGTVWFQDFGLKASSILFLKGRPKFTRLDGTRFDIMRDVCLIGYGKNNSEALKNSGLSGTFVNLQHDH